MFNYGFFGGVPSDLGGPEDNVFYDDYNQYDQNEIDQTTGVFPMQNALVTDPSPEEMVLNENYQVYPQNTFVMQPQQQQQTVMETNYETGMDSLPNELYLSTASSNPLLSSEMGLKPSSTVFLAKPIDGTSYNTVLPINPLSAKQTNGSPLAASTIIPTTTTTVATSSSTSTPTSIPTLLYPQQSQSQSQIQSVTSLQQLQSQPQQIQTTVPALSQQQTLMYQTKPIITREDAINGQEQPTSKKMKISDIYSSNNNNTPLPLSSSSASSSASSSSNSSPSNTTITYTEIPPVSANGASSSANESTTIANIPILSAPASYIGTMKFKVNEKANATTNKGNDSSNILFDACCNGAVGICGEGVKTDGYKALSREKLLKVSSEEMNKYEIFVKTHYRLTPQQEEEIRHQKRLVKSREFAKKSRQRVQEQICALEGKNTALERQVSDLELQNKALKMANTSLLKENANLKDIIKKLNNEGLRFSPSTTSSATTSSSSLSVPAPSSSSASPSNSTSSPPSMKHHYISSGSFGSGSGGIRDYKMNSEEKRSGDERIKPTGITRFNGYILFFVIFSALTIFVYDLPANLFSSPLPSYTSRTFSNPGHMSLSLNEQNMGFPGDIGRGGGGLRKMFLFDSFLPFKSYEHLKYKNQLGQKMGGYSGNKNFNSANSNGQRIIESSCDCDYMYKKGGNETFGVNEWFKDSNGKRTDFLSVLFIYPLCCMILAGRKKNKVRRNKR